MATSAYPGRSIAAKHGAKEAACRCGCYSAGASSEILESEEHREFLGLLLRLAQPSQLCQQTERGTAAVEPIVEELHCRLAKQQDELSFLKAELQKSQACYRELEEAVRQLNGSSAPQSDPSSIGDQQSTSACASTTMRESLKVSEPTELPVPPPSMSTPRISTPRPRLDVMAEVDRIAEAQTPAEVLGIPEDADDAAMQKAWKKLIFALHPDKLCNCSEEDRAQAAEALHSIHQAREEFRESSQANGQVDVPETLVMSERPVVCTRNVPGQRRFECRWEVPEKRDPNRPVEKYEVYGPRIFAHTGEPMEWMLLATLPKLEGCFIFVEESPTQQEVMWAGDRVRSPSIPLTAYAINGRGRSEPLYFYLPWQTKFPWLQGRPSLICRQCCSVQPRPHGKAEKFQCSACDFWISLNAAAVVINCPKCHGEAMWDNPGLRLDCRCCGRCLASVNHRVAPRCIDPRAASTPPLAASQWRSQPPMNGSGGAYSGGNGGRDSRGGSSSGLGGGGRSTVGRDFMPHGRRQ